MRRTFSRMLLSVVAQTAESRRLFYWVDFNTLHSIVRRGDVTDRNHTLSLLESPLMETHWKAFVEDLESQGLRVLDRRVTYEADVCWKWYGSPYVQVMMYKAKGDEYVSEHIGHVPGWMIGATHLFYWTQMQCFLRLPAHEDALLRWRFGSESDGLR